jgi:hypothetical protein
MHARRMNAESRIQNVGINADAETWSAPLVSYQTQELIPDSPQTPQAVAPLPGMTDRHARQLNAESRIRNGRYATFAGASLAFFVSYQTLALIPDFPDTTRDIAYLPGMTNAAIYLQPDDETNVFWVRGRCRPRRYPPASRAEYTWLYRGSTSNIEGRNWIVRNADLNRQGSNEGRRHSTTFSEQLGWGLRR